MLKKGLIVLLILVMITSVWGCEKKVIANYQDLTEEEAINLINSENPLVLDVRTQEEFTEKHLKNATLIPIEELENRYHEILAHQEKAILVYCRSGRRSGIAASFLAKNGFQKVYNLTKGIKELKETSNLF